MKALLYVLGTALIVGVGLAWIVAGANQPDDKVTSQPPAPISRQNCVQASADFDAGGPGYTIVPNPIPTIEEPDLPIYPGMKLVEERRTHIEEPEPYTPALGEVHYRRWATTSSYQDVYAFYKKVLPEQGLTRLYLRPRTVEDVALSAEDKRRVLNGTLFLQDPNDDPNRHLIYEWSDKAGQAPYKLHVNLHVDTDHAAQRSVIMSIPREPDENKMPVHPDAEQIEVSNTKNAEGLGKRTIAYLTPANPKEIAQYYLDVLRQSGWFPSSPYKYAVEFGYAPSLLREGIDGEIVAKVDSSGKTKVEIRISKTDRHQEYGCVK